jgi:hypothetical protein
VKKKKALLYQPSKAGDFKINVLKKQEDRGCELDYTIHKEHCSCATYTYNGQRYEDSIV